MIFIMSCYGYSYIYWDKTTLWLLKIIFMASFLQYRSQTNSSIKWSVSQSHILACIFYPKLLVESWCFLKQTVTLSWIQQLKQTIRVLAIIAICMMMIFSNFKNAIKNSMLVAMTMLLCVCVTSVYIILNGANIFVLFEMYTGDIKQISQIYHILSSLEWCKRKPWSMHHLCCIHEIMWNFVDIIGVDLFSISWESTKHCILSLNTVLYSN